MAASNPLVSQIVSPPQGKPGSRSLMVLLIAFYGFIMIGVPTGFLGVVWPSIQQDFSVSLDGLGRLLLVSTLSYTLSSFMSGQLIARAGLGRVVLICATINMAGLLGKFYAPGWVTLMFWAFFAGLGLGVMETGINIYFAANYPASIVNWLHACFGVGAMLGPLLVTLLLQTGLSWRIDYLIVGVSQIPLLIGVFLTRKRWQVTPLPAASSDAPAREPAKAGLLETLKQPAVWLNLLVFLIYTGVEVSADQWSFSLFTKGRGIDAATAGFWMSIYWGVFTAGRILLGMVIDRLGVVRLLQIGIFGMILGAALLWWNPTNLLGFLGLVLMGFCEAPVFPSMVADTPRLVGNRHAANAMGLQIATAGVGAAFLPVVTGFLATSMGLEVLGPLLLGCSAVLLVVYTVTVLNA